MKNCHPKLLFPFTTLFFVALCGCGESDKLHRMEVEQKKLNERVTRLEASTNRLSENDAGIALLQKKVSSLGTDIEQLKTQAQASAEQQRPQGTPPGFLVADPAVQLARIGTWNLPPGTRPLAAADIRRLLRRPKDVQSDQLSYVGKVFAVIGTVELSSYYNYGYIRAQETHFAFKFEDDEGNSVDIYGVRAGVGKALRDSLTRISERKAKGCFLMKLDELRQKDSSSLLAELVGFGPPLE